MILACAPIQSFLPPVICAKNLARCRCNAVTPQSVHRTHIPLVSLNRRQPPQIREVFLYRPPCRERDAVVQRVPDTAIAKAGHEKTSGLPVFVILPGSSRFPVFRYSLPKSSFSSRYERSAYSGRTIRTYHCLNPFILLSLAGYAPAYP